MRTRLRGPRSEAEGKADLRAKHGTLVLLLPRAIQTGPKSSEIYAPPPVGPILVLGLTGITPLRKFKRVSKTRECITVPVIKPRECDTIEIKTEHLSSAREQDESKPIRVP